MFGFFKKKEPVTEKSPNRNLSFQEVPDGKYIVKFVEEISSINEFLLVVLVITRGEHKGIKQPAMFNSTKAKKVTKDYTGDFLNRLAFEEDAKASKMQDAIDYSKHDSNGEFIVNIKDGFVSSVPEYDIDKFESFLKKFK
jgi:hypothetical protein